MHIHFFIFSLSLNITSLKFQLLFIMSSSTTDQDLQLAATLIHMRHATSESITSTGSTTTSFTPEQTELCYLPSSHQLSSSLHFPSSPTRVTSAIHESTPSSPSPNSFHSDKSVTTSVPLAKPYSPEERKQAVYRYLAKKHRRRNATDKIRYQIRKKIAHARPRYRGRFSKPPL